MNKKIFRYSVLISIFMLLTGIIPITFILYEYFETQLRSQLETEAGYISAAVASEGLSYFDKISGNERITLISPDGTVLADTDVSPENLENHFDRKEVQLALKNGSGSSTRYSKTFTERTVYYAVRLDDGNILRISAKQHTVLSVLIRLLQPIAIILLIMVLASAVLSSRVSKNIIDDDEREKREQLRREFTSNVSHELKTPLTSISGFAEMLMKGGADNETVVDFAKSIYDESQRLIALVLDIIRISELDEGVEFEREEIDLYELAEKTAERLKPEAEKMQVQLRVMGEHAYIKGAPKILDEIIYNLCDNAVKYNRKNGFAEISVQKSEDKINIVVRDTGIGIPKEHRDRIFERFYRIDKARAIGGTGLGLSIVKHGVIYHNGSLSIESEEGKGTTITVSFPA